MFDEWVRRDVGRVFVQMFDTTLANYLDAPGGMCVHARTCGTALALEHNGDLYSCDHFVEPEHLLGNITERPMLELISSPQQVAFGQAKHDDLPGYCRTCTVRFACHGGCPKDRFTTTPDGEPGLHYLCPSYKTFFAHVDKPMRFMAGAAHRPVRRRRDGLGRPSRPARRSHHQAALRKLRHSARMWGGEQRPHVRRSRDVLRRDEHMSATQMLLVAGYPDV